MSETVTRYELRDVSTNPYVEFLQLRPDVDGDWVAYADYAALAQQLADVAYLVEWLSADEGHRWFSRLDGSITAWECMADGKTHVGAAVALDLPALGALLRQREGGR